MVKQVQLAIEMGVVEARREGSMIETEIGTPEDWLPRDAKRCPRLKAFLLDDTRYVFRVLCRPAPADMPKSPVFTNVVLNVMAGRIVATLITDESPTTLPAPVVWRAGHLVVHELGHVAVADDRELFDSNMGLPDIEQIERRRRGDLLANRLTKDEGLRLIRNECRARFIESLLLGNDQMKVSSYGGLIVTVALTILKLPSEREDPIHVCSHTEIFRDSVSDLDGVDAWALLESQLDKVCKQDVTSSI